LPERSGVVAYIGIGYSGQKSLFLKEQVDKNIQWLKGDRMPRFFGDCFIVLYDSNTAREFAKKCTREAEENAIIVYPMQRPLQRRNSDGRDAAGTSLSPGSP
jgi:hypothetical protein